MKERRCERLLQQAIFCVASLIGAIITTVGNPCAPWSQRINYSDSSVYLYIGRLLNNNGMVYKDVFEHKGPIFYVVNALACSINDYWGVWLLDIIVMTGVIMLFYMICKRYLQNILVSIVSCIILLSAIPSSYWIGNTPEFYSLFLELIAFWVLLNFIDKEDLKLQELILVGAITALIFWMKQTLIVPILSFCMCILVYCIYKKEWKKIIRYICLYLCAFVACSSIIVLWVYFKGAFHDMISDFFGFNFFYTKSSNDYLSQIKTINVFLHNRLIILTLITIFAQILMWIWKRKINYSRIMYIIIWSLTFYACCMPGRPYRQYLLILFPVNLLLLISTMKDVFAIIKDGDACYWRVSIVFFLILYMVVLPNVDMCMKEVEEQLTAVNGEKELISVVTSLTTMSDEIIVASPDDCGLYLATKRKTSSKYPYVQALRYDDESFWNEYNKQLKICNPKIVVWAKNWDIELYMPEVSAQYEKVFETDRLAVYCR